MTKTYDEYGQIINDVEQENTYEKFAKKYFGQLKGYIITDFNLEVDPYDSYIKFPTFTMTKFGSPPIKVSVSQDEEGNGGGHLFIEEIE